MMTDIREKEKEKREEEELKKMRKDISSSYERTKEIVLKGFSILSFIFIAAIFAIVLFEVLVTEILPSDERDKVKMNYTDTMYGSFGLERFGINLNPQQQQNNFLIPQAIHFAIAQSDEEIKDEDTKHREGMYEEEDD